MIVLEQLPDMTRIGFFSFANFSFVIRWHKNYGYSLDFSFHKNDYILGF